MYHRNDSTCFTSKIFFFFFRNYFLFSSRKKLPEGRRINFTKLTELSDLRVLCSLVNYFIPNLIPTEILLNDRLDKSLWIKLKMICLLNRWSLNLSLAIIDDVLCCKSNLNSEDLVLVNQYSFKFRIQFIFQADEMSICAFMCYFFLIFFKYRQNEIAIRRVVEIFDRDKIPPNFLCYHSGWITSKTFQCCTKTSSIKTTWFKRRKITFRTRNIIEWFG